MQWNQDHVNRGKDTQSTDGLKLVWGQVEGRLAPKGGATQKRELNPNVIFKRIS